MIAIFSSAPTGCSLNPPAFTPPIGRSRSWINHQEGLYSVDIATDHQAIHPSTMGGHCGARHQLSQFDSRFFLLANKKFHRYKNFLCFCFKTVVWVWVCGETRQVSRFPLAQGGDGK